jgi:hypothetical protein
LTIDLGHIKLATKERDMEEEKQQEKVWGSAREVLAILSEVNGREINPKMLTELSKKNKLKREEFDGRTFQYYLPDARNLIIPARPGAGNRKTVNRRSKETPSSEVNNGKEEKQS